MAIESLISWHAPAHFHVEKRQDWYWVVGIITLALSAICIIFGQVLTGIFVVVASVALVVHASHPPRHIEISINDRGILIDKTLYPFLSLDSFWIPHDEEFAPKLLLKSRKLLMPLIVVYVEEVDPEDIRTILLRYIAETEHHEPFLKHILEAFGF
jgi:hypothetical protein